MEQLAVSTSDGRIYIIQESYGDDDSTIRINPEQVELLIKWLIEAREELQGD